MNLYTRATFYIIRRKRECSKCVGHKPQPLALGRTGQCSPGSPCRNHVFPAVGMVMPAPFSWLGGSSGIHSRLAILACCVAWPGVPQRQSSDGRSRVHLAGLLRCTPVTVLKALRAEPGCRQPSNTCQLMLLSSSLPLFLSPNVQHSYLCVPSKHHCVRCIHDSMLQIRILQRPLKLETTSICPLATGLRLENRPAALVPGWGLLCVCLILEPVVPQSVFSSWQMAKLQKPQTMRAQPVPLLWSHRLPSQWLKQAMDRQEPAGWAGVIHLEGRSARWMWAAHHPVTTPGKPFPVGETDTSISYLVPEPCPVTLEFRYLFLHIFLSHNDRPTTSS